MARVTEVRTKYTSEGAEKLEKGTVKMDRATTRLGQSAASSGRQFSSQAKGLGGLVAVYAGAAANVFALQQAFSALSKAAQFEQLISGTDTLAASVGAMGSEVISTLKEITNEQLTIAEAATTANIALSAGFNIDQINKLGEVSLKASRALGRNLTDALTRLSRGTAKLEPELLDELGIFTRLEPALEAYALQTGKSVQSLTAFERRQAFVNAAIEEGNRKFGNINTSVPTTAEAFEKLAASFIDLATKVGSFLAETLVPLAEFFTDNLLAQFTLFGVVAKTVFGIGLQAVGAGVRSFFGGVGNVVDGVLLKLSKVGPSAAKQTAALEGIGDRFTTKGFSLSRVRDKETINPLVRQAREGTLNAAGAVRLQKALKEEQQTLKLRRSEIIKQIKANGGFTKSSKTLQKEYRANTAALRQLNPRLSVLTSRLAAAGGMAAKIGPAFIKLEGIFKKVSGTVGKFVAAFRKLGIIGLIAGGLTAALGQFFGFSTRLNEILESLNQRLFGGFFGKEQEKTVKDGIAGIVDTIINESEQLKNVNELVRKKVLGGPDSNVDSFGFDFIVTTDKIKRAMFKSIDSALQDIAQGRDQEAVIQAAIEQNLDKQFGTAAGAVEQQIVDNPLARVIAEATRKAIVDSLTSAELLGGIGKEIGQSVGSILAVLEAEVDGQFVTLTTKEGGGLFERFFGSPLGVEATFNMAAKGGKQLAGIYARSQQFLTELQKGTSSLEKAQRDQAEIETRIRKLEEKGLHNLALTERMQLKTAKMDAERSKKLVDQLTALENQRKVIEGQFSSEIKAAGRLTDIFNEQGILIKDQAEARTLQRQQAAQALREGEAALKKRREGKKLGEAEQMLAARAATAEKALVGSVVKNLEAIKKFNKELDKRVLKMIEQTKQLRIQNKIANLNQDMELLKKQEELRKSTLEIEKKKTEQLREQADIQKELNRFLADDQLRMRETIMGAASGLFTSRQKQGLELTIATQELERILADQKETMKRAAEDRDKEIESINKQLSQNEKINALEDQRLKQEKILAKARLTARLSALNLERTALNDRFKVIDKERDLFNQFIDALARVLATDRVDRQIAAEAAKNIIPTQTREQRVSAAMGDVKGQLAAQVPAVLSIKSFDIALADLRKQLKLQLSVMDDAEAKEILRLTRLIEENELKAKLGEATEAYNIAQGKSTLAIKKAEDALANLRKQAEITNNRGIKVAIAGIESFGENAKKSLGDLFTAIREGTLTVQNFKEGFKDFIFNIVNDIQASITEQFIVDPLKDMLAESLQGFFPGLGGKPDGSSAMKALHVTFPGAGGGPSALLNSVGGGDPLDPDAEDYRLEDFNKSTEKATQSTNVLTTAFDKIKTVSGTLWDKLTQFGGGLMEALGGLGKFASSLIGSFSGGPNGSGSGILGMVGGVGSAIFGEEGIISSVFNMFGAAGGLAHLAAGGTSRRDRIPAMLEPGEFVIRKPMAKAIGGPALHAMNGTGAMPGGNVVVNIENKGTPQDAQASQPRFDGDKFVIDIVTRDIRNNGPIRKSLRGER